ncbi:polysaccharide pyruvyl transferase family protein [Gorillibacterium massiliense]|uniref:polysaccharide pyruvyl transferase family protein n=1 Tax=Gorillibacterium massiliense TaxID=1280390 RepID=UPI0004AC5FB5|nr:polysaccharide pyruvyl transferase family protein [Gorillibacterium massiliense]
MGRAVLQIDKFRIVICGYYGFRNSGDEAVLQSILLALEAEGERLGVTIEPIVMSGDPEWTTRMYGVKAVPRMKMAQVIAAIRSSDGLISGGGSLLQDATGKLSIPYYLGILKLAQWLGKPTFIYSQGIGPVNRSVFFPLIRSTFAKCKYVSVRDAESAELLRSVGYRGQVDVVPDPVMGLPLKAETDGPDAATVGTAQLPSMDAPAGAAHVAGHTGSPADESDAGSGNEEPAGDVSAITAAQSGAGDRDIVGVSIRFWNGDRSELHALAEALNALRQSRPVELRFLPFHLPSDVEASQYVIGAMGAEGDPGVVLVDGIEHPQDMLAAVSECQLMIGMRLHSLIYAASQSVPVLGISYDPKIDQFLNRLGMSSAARTDRFDAALVAAEAAALLDGRTAWQREKTPLIAALKQESRKPVQRILAFMRQL